MFKTIMMAFNMT